METQKLTRVIFDRAHWITGRLCQIRQEQEPKFCAIGFYMNQIGFAPQTLRRGVSPQEVLPSELWTYRFGYEPTPEEQAELKDFAEKLVSAGAAWLVCPIRNANGTVVGFTSSIESGKIILANDAKNGAKSAIDNVHREQKLTDLFAKHGIEVEFK